MSLCWYMELEKRCGVKKAFSWGGFFIFHKKSGLVERWTVKFRYTNDLIADWSLFWFGYERVL